MIYTLDPYPFFVEERKTYTDPNIVFNTNTIFSGLRIVPVAIIVIFTAAFAASAIFAASAVFAASAASARYFRYLRTTAVAAAITSHFPSRSC